VNTAPLKPFEVFFDGGCPLCKREIAMIRRKDVNNRLKLTDISTEGFQSADRTLDQLMREIHGRLPSGEYVTGVEVFREIYDRLGFGFLSRLSKVVGIRHLLDAGYRFFAYFRFRHAMHRMEKRKSECQECEVKPRS
jgi:predicted DCC family thiol-disulfide oxidoreductase YuxK